MVVEKKVFLKQVVVSTILFLMAVSCIVGLYVYIVFYQYSPPTDNTTTLARGTVKEVYYHSKLGDVCIVMTNEAEYRLTSPNKGTAQLRKEIGYSTEQLATLLEGNEIQYRYMDRLSWITQIYIGNTVIDNTKLTNDTIVTCNIATAVICLIGLAFPVCGYVYYLRTKYARYQGAERKRKKKEKRAQRLEQKNQK